MFRSEDTSKIVLGLIAVVSTTSLFIMSPLDRQKVEAHSTLQETQNSEKTATEEDDPIVPPPIVSSK